MVGKKITVLLTLSLGASLVSPSPSRSSKMHPAGCISRLMLLSHHLQEAGGLFSLPCLPPCRVPARCLQHRLTPGELPGLFRCLEQEPECGCHA